MHTKSVLRLRSIAIILAATSLLALSSCSAIEVKLGTRVSLSKTPVTSIEARLANDPGIAPGEKSPLIVTVTEPTGQILTTEGKGKGKVLWKELTVTPTLVTADKKGNLTLAHDPRVSDGKMAHVTITVPTHPGIVADLDIPVTYNYAFVSTYAGADGSTGSSGSNGQDGSAGISGSTDPDNPTPGGDGGNGTNGSDGGNGGDGYNGPAVQVVATLRAGDHPLLQIGVTAAGAKHQHLYLVDPTGGSLTVKSLGGSGGVGGKGGRGGSGGAGGSGSPPGNSGTSGNSGSDGASGSDGSGGPITVTYDPSVQPYLATIRLSNPGGPKPVFIQAPVAPLW
jgi:hypothetical protein